MDKNTGGSAFPVAAISQNAGTGETTLHQSDGGMSLRDYFAAKAMQGYIVALANVFGEGPEKFDAALSRWAYETADAMLTARDS
ncbi:hypothetical protein [Ralstonia mannitolilytica]|uniref:Uncharacterized protein n=1 Tax=Ralstonia mannitolilytica TaxID=105219 RepID=A0AAD2AYD9_9RALS|nr:hypothetical protein [Ralstonia mannitolilytica]MBY4721009.1 hypothetical protein [Ralstonia mannitolilytica]CAJ0693040.1 hypothetical protein R77591_04020 [Ralstonia mannitolilytica]